MAEQQIDEYYAAFDNFKDAVPWGLFKTKGVTVFRYIPHRKSWVPMNNQWDFVAIGMSSDANGTRPITPAQATFYQSQVRDMLDEELVKEFEDKVTV